MAKSDSRSRDCKHQFVWLISQAVKLHARIMRLKSILLKCNSILFIVTRYIKLIVCDIKHNLILFGVKIWRSKNLSYKETV